MSAPYALIKVKQLTTVAVKMSIGGKEGIVLNNEGSRCLLEYKSEEEAEKHGYEVLTRKQAARLIQKKGWVKELPVNRGPNDAAKAAEKAAKEAADAEKEAQEVIEIEKEVTRLKAEAPEEVEEVAPEKEIE